MRWLVRLLFVLTAALTAACSFDSAALDARPPCDGDEDCPSGICLGGSCWNRPADDPDTTTDGGLDADLDTDVTPDVDGGVCTPGAMQCDGNVAERCTDDGDGWLRSDCSDPVVCPTADCVCSAGACVPGTCTPGETRCEGATVIRCNPSGASWSDVEDCGAGTTCQSGACVPNTCTPGTTFCSGDRLVSCTEDGDPSITADCRTSNAWCQDTPNPHCEPWTCTPYGVRCADDASAVERCTPRGDAWVVEDACGEGETCDAAECVELLCESGAQRCVGPTTYGTCAETGDAETLSACEAGTYCASDGTGTVACLTQTCAPGARRCVDGVERVEVCDERGADFSITIDCGATDYCLEGICTAQVCTPNQARCAGAFELRVCDARGTREVATPCASGTTCVESAGSASCIPQTCTPGTPQCADEDTVEVCNDAGTGFEVDETCGASETCDAGTCKPVICDDETFECPSPTVWRQCAAGGTRWDSGNCAGGTICSVDDRGCVPHACTPGTRTCDGDDVLVCDSDGAQYEFVETCEVSCTDGSCNAAECGDGIVSEGEACDDGNTNPCDGCDSCRIARAGTLVSNSVTTSNVVWAPEEGDFTMEAWVSVTTNTGSLFGLGRRTGDDHVWVGLDAGRVVFEYRLSADELVQVTGTTNLNGAGWHHVAVVRFATWGAAIYVNGQLEAIAHQARSASSINGATHIWVGSDSTTTSAAGRIDHVRLSDVHRYSDYFTPARRYAADGATIGLYNFDDATNAALADTSGNGRDLTVANITRIADACYGAPANSLVCGDGVKASWEGCDDGNTTSGDGCSSSCVTEVCRSDERLGPGGHCYHVVTSTRNWERAQDICDDRGSGSNLVTVNSATENTWMTFMLGLSGSHWIGLTDSGWGSEGNYRWVRGSSGYRYWAPGEPNDGGSWASSEDCVGLFGTSGGANAGRWNDFRCSESLRAVCERY